MSTGITKNLSYEQVLDNFVDMFELEMDSNIYMTWYDRKGGEFHEILDQEQIKDIAKKTAKKLLERIQND